ncbi:MAG: hypothetical protein HWN81_18355 [Candidatus Lokiarchaeota archaeon]|nr:hypothetical protein [Candidatus Lokiarchaeota archaeon]
MRNVIILLFVILSFCFMCDRANAHWPWQNHIHPHSYYSYQPRVYYQPQIVWLPQGSSLNINNVYVDPYRRNVRIGINYGFYYVPQVQTFNFYNGQQNQRR